MRGLEQRIALVTGAAGGIGRAICRRLLQEGAEVIACDIDADALAAFVEEVDMADAAIFPQILDITDSAAVQQVIAAVEARQQRLDILVNNAGWDIARPFVETEPALWDKVIAINLHGPLNLHKAALPLMIAAGGGKIINIASDAGRVGSSGEAVYAACKGGLIAFSKTVARETARNNILINVVCPGPTDTPLLHSFAGEGAFGEKLLENLKRAIPLRRLGQPEDLAGMVAFLASADADFITGQVFSVSGGLTMHD